MTLLIREADETGGPAKRSDGVLELPYLRLPLLLAIEAQVQCAADFRHLRGQPLVVGRQGVPPGDPLGRQLGRLLGYVGMQRLELFSLLLEVGQSRFIRLLVCLQRRIVGAHGVFLLTKPSRVLDQARSFAGPLLLSAAQRLERLLLISLLACHPLVKGRELSQEFLASRQDILEGGRPRRLGCHASTTARQRCAGGSGLSRGLTSATA